MHHDASSQSLSIWIDTTPATSYPSLGGDIEVDVAIVGGGITGITAAWILARAGRSVALLEKGRIAMSETGHTTAHIVSSTDADYEDLIKEHGEENARLNTRAILDSIEFMKKTIGELKIDCAFREVPGYLYTEVEEHREYLQRQREFLDKSLVPTVWVDRVPLPFSVLGALRFDRQHEFHIRKYLLPLAEDAVKEGAKIFEQTHVEEVENGEPCLLRTDRGTVRAREVLLTTHAPLNDRGALWVKMAVTRTYVVAAPIEGRDDISDGLYWDTEMPYHYTRTLKTDRGRYLIVGGEDRPVGDPENDEERYTALEAYCRERFKVSEFPYRWSGQINEPADMLPFIGGTETADHVYRATAYSGTGMTYGTVAAMLLSDLVLGRANPYTELFAPRRTKLKSIVEEVKETMRGPRRLVAKALGLDVETKSLDDVAPGEGRIVKVDGEKLAVYRATDGTITSLDPTCTHMGCTVAWNGLEKSWDCPCHGSRFAIDGQVLNSPATTPLAKK
jgi:glycine/D-amino acid oxidase-like deaminating enzyme/nitrite reductase/ring-hydroxylating ferredoxin subunit